MLSHLPTSSVLEGLSSEQFAEFESVHFSAFSAEACSLAFLSLGVSFLAICRAVLIYLVLFSGLFLGLFLFSDSVDFVYSKGSFILFFSGLFRESSSNPPYFTVLFFLALRISGCFSSENAY